MKKQFQMRQSHKGVEQKFNLSDEGVTRFPAQENTEYQFYDEQGNPITPQKIVVDGDDLLIYLDGTEQPNLVLQDFAEYYPVELA